MKKAYHHLNHIKYICSKKTQRQLLRWFQSKHLKSKVDHQNPSLDINRTITIKFVPICENWDTCKIVYGEKNATFELF